MSHRFSSPVSGIALAMLLGVAGCQEQKAAPTSPSEANQLAGAAHSSRLEGAQLKLPASGRVTDDFGRLTQRAIIPSEHVCGPTEFDTYIDNILAPIDPDVQDILFGDLADVLPTVDALLFVTEDTPQFFGFNGEYNKIMPKIERDVKRFWDIPSDDIQLLAMHGTMLLDEARVARAYENGFTIAPGVPVPHALAVLLAQEVHAAVLADPDLNGGNHPIFTLNAFAFSDDAGVIPDKVVMGDGILDAFKTMGYDDVAPRAIYAHEFGHQIQFENGYFDDVVPGATTQAELTRYTELMADAFAGYYLTHKRGGTLNQKRVEEFLQVYFDIGDCAFTNPGHHGTPNQRLRAARFGFSVANAAQKQGQILTSEQFHTLFVAAYPGIVAPDAT